MCCINKYINAFRIWIPVGFVIHHEAIWNKKKKNEFFNVNPPYMPAVGIVIRTCSVRCKRRGAEDVLQSYIISWCLCMSVYAHIIIKFSFVSGSRAEIKIRIHASPTNKRMDRQSRRDTIYMIITIWVRRVRRKPKFAEVVCARK